MNEHQASRTLLKSPPELWAECSDAQSLSKHFGDSIGEIQITKLEPEHTVAWEGDRASGTVRLEPSGWGTRVTLTCSTTAVEEVGTAAEPRRPEPEPAPAANEAGTEPPPTGRPRDVPPAEAPREVSPADAPRGKLFARMMRWFAPGQLSVQPLAPVAEQSSPEATAPESAGASEPGEAREPGDASQPGEALAAALESLGQAHHRPFSRA
jgi:hypothetical protein